MGRAVVLLLAILTVAGCSDSTSPLSDRWYYLVTVNGSLPAVVSQTPSEKDEIISGDLFVNPDQTWSIDLITRATIGQSVSLSDIRSSGTWTQTKDQYSFRDNTDNSVVTGVYTGGNHSLTFTRNGLTYVYQRHPAGSGVGF
jgi:hypothetical protein